MKKTQKFKNGADGEVGQRDFLLVSPTHLPLVGVFRIVEMSSSGKASPQIPTIQEVRDKCQAVFGVRPCLWQCKVLEATLKRSNVVVDVGTGAGKTLSFFLPLLFQPRGIQIIVTALNILGKQNVATLNKAKISAISISGETSTPQNFRVSWCTDLF